MLGRARHVNGLDVEGSAGDSDSDSSSSEDESDDEDGNREGYKITSEVTVYVGARV